MPLRLLHITVASAIALAIAAQASPELAAQGDLDRFMREVLTRRDDNWRKLQQYVLDEHERFQLRGPARAPLFGEERDYTWYIRDGFFVRSPLKVNGADVPEPDRRCYEADYLARARRREARAQAGGDETPDPVPPPAPSTGADLDSVIRQTRQPQFISSAYFLKFRFDAGHYALVGRETLEGRQVVRVEYYPSNLFRDESRRPREGETEAQRRRRARDEADDQQLMRLMNKTSRVTLWIEPTRHQIVKYVFEDLGWNFFPAQWAVRVSHVDATMTVGEMFPEVWLPRSLTMDFAMLMAAGPIDAHYALEYHDYRQPDVTAKVGSPDPH